MKLVYPEQTEERDQWIVGLRGSRESLDPQRPKAFFVEEERSAGGAIVSVATIFLTNRECPWRCLMCDLWRNTLTDSVPRGAIPSQIDYALERMSAAKHLKLYNSGSFFDRGAIPVEDYPAISGRAGAFERVIVESHPALVGDACLRFRDLLGVDLEVAMGLETVHPDILPRLNKRMTLGQFETAAVFLRTHRIDLRVFVLVKPPFMREEDAMTWAAQSLDFAFDCGATAVSLIPTRTGNGAMNALEFKPPKLETLEKAFAYGLKVRRGRVFADLWDVGACESCPTCVDAREARLRTMNLCQEILPIVPCRVCGAGL